MVSRGPERSPSRHGAPGPLLELTVDSVAFGGDGVARHQGLVVLVEGGLPGERVRARMTRRSRNFARAQVEEILSPSSSRVPVPCLHFPECGGCAYQALDYSVQPCVKRRQVADLLERVGRFPAPPVAPALAPSEPFHYRSRMTYGLPLRKDSGPGLHLRGVSGGSLEVEACLLPERDLQRAYLGIRGDLRRLQPRGRPLRIELQAGEPGERPVALLHGRGDPGTEVLRLATLWTGQGGPLGGVVWSREVSEGDRVRCGRTRVLEGRGHVFRRLGPFQYRIPAGSFFQANASMAVRLFEETVRRCRGAPGGILELYCGVGALSLFLAGTGSPVLAVEGDRSAVQAAQDNSRANGVQGIEFRAEEAGGALRRLEASSRRFDTVVADPPRTGLPRGTAPLLGRLARERILYLSCNPSTLARDLREIVAEGKWQVSEVVPADFFPMTAEIECLAELLPRPSLSPGAGGSRPA